MRLGALSEEVGGSRRIHQGTVMGVNVFRVKVCVPGGLFWWGTDSISPQAGAGVGGHSRMDAVHGEDMEPFWCKGSAFRAGKQFPGPPRCAACRMALATHQEAGPWDLERWARGQDCPL